MSFPKAIALNNHGRATIVPFAPGDYAYLSQCAQKIFNRPLAHSFISIDAKPALSKCYESSQETHACSRVGHVQFGRKWRIVTVVLRTWTDDNLRQIPLFFNPEPKLAKRVHHNLRILATERSAQFTRPIPRGNCRQHQRPIRYALRSRHSRYAGNGLADRQHLQQLWVAARFTRHNSPALGKALPPGRSARLRRGFPGSESRPRVLPASNRGRR